MNLMQRFLREARLHWLRKKYREGAIVSRFVARDVKREILVLSSARIAEGIITGRCRTTNILYRSHGIVPESPFGDPQEIPLADAWKWTGQSWGGLPDGTSLAVREPTTLPSDSR